MAPSCNLGLHHWTCCCTDCLIMLPVLCAVPSAVSAMVVLLASLCMLVHAAWLMIVTQGGGAGPVRCSNPLAHMKRRASPSSADADRIQRLRAEALCNLLVLCALGCARPLRSCIVYSCLLLHCGAGPGSCAAAAQGGPRRGKRGGEPQGASIIALGYCACDSVGLPMSVCLSV